MLVHGGSFLDGEEPELVCAVVLVLRSKMAYDQIHRVSGMGVREVRIETLNSPHYAYRYHNRLTCIYTLFYQKLKHELFLIYLDSLLHNLTPNVLDRNDRKIFTFNAH